MYNFNIQIKLQTILGLLMAFMMSNLAIAQKAVIHGKLTDRSKPQAKVEIIIPNFMNPNDTIHYFTNEKGEYDIEVDSLTVKDLFFKFPQYTKVFHNRIDYKTHLCNFETTSKILVITWKGDAGFQFSGSFFSTYQPTGNNSNQVTILTKANFNHNIRVRKFSHNLDGKFLYGLTHTQIKLGTPTSTYLKYADSKSADLLSLTSKLNYALGKKVSLTALSNLQTQFMIAYRDPFAEERGQPLVEASNFFAPARINVGIGLDFLLSEGFSIYYSPLDLHSTYVKDEVLRKNFSIPAGHNHLSQVGSFMNVNLAKKLSQKLNYNMTLQMFTSYVKNQKNPDIEKPGTIDLQLFKQSLTYNFNKYFSLGVTTVVTFDEDVEYDLLTNDSKTGAPLNQQSHKWSYFHNFGLSMGYTIQNRKKK
jgi:hypothetical protein